MTALDAAEHALTSQDKWNSIEQRIDDARNAATSSDARAAAAQSLGPLDGVPFAVKANLDIAGLATTAGTAVTRAKAERDAEVVRQLREAGAIPVLTTTLAEAAIGSVTANPWTGACANPHDPAFNAGGSSGGSAAVVAAGLVPFALGTDTMGSVRIPAACCGIFGWKPSLGAISTQGTVPLSERLDTVGFLAASARDLALLAEVVLDPSGNRSPSVAHSPLRIRRLDVETGFGAIIDNAASAAVRQVFEVLGALDDTDADADAAVITIDPALVRRRGLLVCEADAAEAWATELAARDRGLSPTLTALLLYGRDTDPARVQAARATCDEVAEQVINVMDDASIDVLVLPTIPSPPPRIDADPPGLADLTAWVNLAGLPSVSLPTRVHVDGEPVPRSVQLVGRHGNDRALLALVAAVEAELDG